MVELWGTWQAYSGGLGDPAPSGVQGQSPPEAGSILISGAKTRLKLKR